MDKMIKINGKDYIAKDFDLNAICDLEEMGVSLEDFSKKPMSFMRGYVAICANRDAEYAGAEIEQHIIDGGKFDKIAETIAQKVEESGFFRSLNQTAEQETSTGKSKKKA